MRPAPILAIPPFPGARAPAFALPGEGLSGHEQGLLDALARHRVGGCYWGAQPRLPREPFLLDGTTSSVEDAVAWPVDADPWYLLDHAKAARLPEGDSRCLLVLAAGKPLTLARADGSDALPDNDLAANLVRQHLVRWHWRNPFDGSAMSPIDAIELCGFWRSLIDSNRSIVAAMGFAYWKKSTVAPLLWAGRPVPFKRRLSPLADGQVAIWRSRLSATQTRDLASRDGTLLEVEDGFIRSAGLGANCVPPLSIVVDANGAHFDPTQPSRLEDLIQEGGIAAETIERAANLRNAIVTNGLSKYERGTTPPLNRPGGKRRHILVPGQVEDDRAVTSGGALPSNLELIRRARAEAGFDAFLIYKPHPDVLAGHRRGKVSEVEMKGLVDRVETEVPMASLIAMVDELHVNSSLAGFEALLRGKKVTVHGVPFYAGWGLTIDRGPVPPRRSARRTLDELVAAALLLYPRYLDPETGLPCPAEVLVDRLSAAAPKLNPAALATIALRTAAGRSSRFLGA